MVIRPYSDDNDADVVTTAINEYACLQVEAARASLKQDLIRRQAQILQGKKAKRDKILQERRAAGEDISDSEFEKDVDFDVNSIAIPSLPEKHSMVQIHTGVKL